MIMAKDKARYFTFLLYPESVPEGWQEKLAEIGQPMAISPLHDKDVKPDGTLKKAHWHIIYIASNPVTTDSVRKKIQRNLGSQSAALVQIISTTVENTFLYFTHETQDAINKHKALYSAKDIKLLNNFDIDRYIVLDVEDKDDILNDVCDLIDEQGLANIRELRRFVKNHGTEYNLPSMKILNSVLRSHTGLLRLYFDAVYQERRYGRLDYDKETGEIKGMGDENGMG